MKTGHFIITLFNLRLKWAGREKSLQVIDPGTDESYLKNSFSRFENYTVPSMLNQTNKNFKWLVLFSADTPPKFTSKIIGGGYANSLYLCF